MPEFLKKILGGGEKSEEERLAGKKGSDALNAYQELRREGRDVTEIPAKLMDEVGNMYRDLGKPGEAAALYAGAASRYVCDEAWAGAQHMIKKAERLIGKRNTRLWRISLQVALGRGEPDEAGRCLEELGQRLTASDGDEIAKLVDIIDKEGFGDPRVDIALAHMLTGLGRPDWAIERLEDGLKGARRRGETELAEQIERKIQDGRIERPAAEQEEGVEVDVQQVARAQTEEEEADKTTEEAEETEEEAEKTTEEAEEAEEEEPAEAAEEPPEETEEPAAEAEKVEELPEEDAEQAKPAADQKKAPDVETLEEAEREEPEADRPEAAEEPEKTEVETLGESPEETTKEAAQPAEKDGEESLPELEEAVEASPEAGEPARDEKEAREPQPGGPAEGPGTKEADEAEGIEEAEALEDQELELPQPEEMEEAEEETEDEQPPEPDLMDLSALEEDELQLVPEEEEPEPEFPDLGPEELEEAAEEIPGEAPPSMEMAEAPTEQQHQQRAEQVDQQLDQVEDSFVELADLLRDEKRDTIEARQAKDEETRFVGTDIRDVTEDEKEEVDELVKQLREGLREIVPENEAQTHYDLGLSFMQMDRFDDAVDSFQAAYRSPEFRIRAAEGLSQSLLGRGDPVLARRAAEVALKELSKPDKAVLGLLYWLARANEDLGRIDEATDLYERICLQDTHFADAHDRLHNILEG